MDHKNSEFSESSISKARARKHRKFQGFQLQIHRIQFKRENGIPTCRGFAVSERFVADKERLFLVVGYGRRSADVMESRVGV